MAKFVITDVREEGSFLHGDCTPTLQELFEMDGSDGHGHEINYQGSNDQQRVIFSQTHRRTNGKPSEQDEVALKGRKMEVHGTWYTEVQEDMRGTCISFLKE